MCPFSKVTCDCTCLGHPGQHDTDRIISILCRTAEGAQGKYSSDCCVSRSPMLLLTNFPNVNDPLRVTLENVLINIDAFCLNILDIFGGLKILIHQVGLGFVLSGHGRQVCQH
jgi:hypothetical protein